MGLNKNITPRRCDIFMVKSVGVNIATKISIKNLYERIVDMQKNIFITFKLKTFCINYNRTYS